MQVPFFNPKPMHAPIREALHKAATDVIDSGAYILGKQVAEFESEVGEYLGVEHAIGVNSGTDALVLGLEAAGVKPGDEVIVPSWTFFATSESVLQVGAIPVFVDIQMDGFISPVAAIEAAISSKTTAIIAVHLYGRVVELGALADRCASDGIAIIEDTAQAFGATFQQGSLAGKHAGGAFIGAYSFFPTKNLGGIGDGGLVTTNDASIAERVRMLRAHGGLKKYQNEIKGYNSRLDALQAAMLRVKLPHIEEWNASRRAVAQRYNDQLGDVVDTPSLVDGHVMHQYTLALRSPDIRDQVQASMKDAGVPTMVYYPVPNHKLPVFEHAEHIRSGKLQTTTEASKVAMSLPMYPQMPNDQIDVVCKALREALA